MLSSHNGAIQAVIFDLDGVLLDSEWLAFEVWQQIALEYGGTLPDTAFPSLIGTTAEETARLVMQATGLRFDLERNVALAWDRVVERLKTELEPRPGAPALVQSLAQRGMPLAIASNALGWYIDDALRSLRLDPYFPIRVSVEQVQQGKPAPDVYLEAARRVGVEPRHCLAVEDSRVGVQAAAAAGMRVVAVPHALDQGGGFEPAWRVCRSLGEAQAGIAEMLGW